MKRLLVPLLLASGVCAQSAEPVRTRVPMGEYTVLTRCSGQGGPAVVLIHGLDSGLNTWSRVESEVARFTRVCSYNVPTRGMIRPAPARSRTSLDVAKDLRLLLQKLKLEPPYLVVGHDLGVYHARVFAGTYRKEVAGMVLIDGADEDQADYIAVNTSRFGYDASSIVMETRQSHPVIGDMPVFVISAGTEQSNPGWLAAQRKLAQRFSNKKHQIVDAGHFVQETHPQVVAQAIREAWAAAKNNKPLR